MPKNALYLLKNRKNRRALGAPPPDPRSDSNNAGIWGRSSQPLGENGGLGVEPSTLRRFFTVFTKKYTFLNILGSKFLLKTRF